MIHLNNQNIYAKTGFKALVLSNFASKQKDTLALLIKDHGLLDMRAMNMEELFEVVDFSEK